MHVMKNVVAELLWNERSESACGDVTMKRVTLNGLSGELESGIIEELLCGGAGWLELSNLEEGKRWSSCGCGREKCRNCGGWLGWRPGEGISYHIVGARSVKRGDGVLRDVGQLALLACRLWCGYAMDSVD